MALKKQQHKVKTKNDHRAIKFVLVYAAYVVLAYLIGLLLQWLPVQLVYLKDLTMQDVDFTDIYYQTGFHKKAKKDVVLINIGSVPKDSLRYRLPAIIDSLSKDSAKAIGLDIYFAPDDSIPVPVNQRLDSVIREKKVVIGVDVADQSQFPLHKTDTVNFGCINFLEKEGKTIREYAINREVAHLGFVVNVPSFACALYHRADNLAQPIKTDSPVFRIHYNSSATGFYNVLDTMPDLDIDTLVDFPAIEAIDLFNANDTVQKTIKRLVYGKIVIVGWLGNPQMGNAFNIRDKHRVPVDFALYNRQPVMPGAVVHANVVQMLVRNKPIRDIDGWRHVIIRHSVMLLFFCLFFLIGRIHFFLPVFLLEIVLFIAGSLLLILTSLRLMQGGYHIRIGDILLHFAILVEYLSFAHNMYDWLEKKGYPENWIAQLREWKIVRKKPIKKIHKMTTKKDKK